MRILIADDDGVSRMLVTRMLQHFGHEVTLAHDGSHAWQLLQQPNAPYLVILDWLMPGMDGVTLCEKLRASDRDVRPYVILLTAMNNSKDFLAGIKAGADDYIKKPFDPDELFIRVHAGEIIVNLQIESLAARDALRKQVTYEPLTAVRNREAILSELQRECETIAKSNTPFSIVLADIDQLKNINDTHGHQIGDRVLAETARRMAAESRTYEKIGRCADKEFLIVLPGCDSENLPKVAEHIRKSVAAQEFNIQGTKIPVTVSIGAVACMDMTEAIPKVMMDRAESALQQAKQNGRNRVELA